MARPKTIGEEKELRFRGSKRQERLSRIVVNSGGRLPPLRPEEFSPEQRRLAYEISTFYGGKVDGPHAIWIRSPELAEKTSRLNTQIRTYGKLDRRLFELTVLLAARHYRAQFEWCVHEPSALRAGLSEEALEAIRAGVPPKLRRADEKLTYRVVTEIMETGTLTPQSYGRAIEGFGEERLIEMVTVAGFYTLVAFVLNVFEAPLPPGREPPFEV